MVILKVTGAEIRPRMTTFTYCGQETEIRAVAFVPYNLGECGASSPSLKLKLSALPWHTKTCLCLSFSTQLQNKHYYSQFHFVCTRVIEPSLYFNIGISGVSGQCFFERQCVQKRNQGFSPI